MPPKKSNLNSSCSKEARRKRLKRAHQSAEQIAARNAVQRIRAAENRIRESPEQRDENLGQNISRPRAACKLHITTFRVEERERQQTSRALTHALFDCLVFEYAPNVNYSAHSKIAIGTIDQKCQYCQALKFGNKKPDIYRASGKVVLLPLPTPSEPLKSLFAG